MCPLLQWFLCTRVTTHVHQVPKCQKAIVGINGRVYCFHDLFLQEHCKKHFLLMDCFWNEINDFNFNLKWQFKVRNYLQKFERKLQETKRKKLSNLPKNAEIKKSVLAYGTFISF